MRLLIVTGLPAAGKSTLARQLAAHYQLPLLAKDTIKESLLDETGPVDAAHSRRLSDLAFNMLFAQLQQHADTGVDTLLEGNFRAGQHEAQLAAVPAAQIAQILCRVDAGERQRRISERAGGPSRHPGHGDAQAPHDASNDQFLELPGERLLFNTGDEATQPHELLRKIDRWWQASAS